MTAAIFFDMQPEKEIQSGIVHSIVNKKYQVGTIKQLFKEQNHLPVNNLYIGKN